jgi:hypothetical protein
MKADTDFARFMETVARDLLGEPDIKRGNEWRYGTNESLSIDIKSGTWFDHDAKVGGGVLDLIKREKGLEAADARQYLRELGCDVRDEPKPKGRRELEISYLYTDEYDNPLYQVQRWVYRLPDRSLELTKDGKRRKSFTQRRSDGKGGWIEGKDCMKGVRWVPFRLSDLLEAMANNRTILSVEGEKCADLLWTWNVPATCNAGGSKNWKGELNRYFEGADLVLMGDNDTAGAAHVEKVGSELHGIAASIAVLKLPNLPPKGDIVDWAAAGGTVEELHRLIATATTPWTPAPGTLVDDGRPLIEIAGGALMENLAKIEAAIIADVDHAAIFQRGDMLVRLVHVDSDPRKSCDINRAANALTLRPLNPQYLMTRMAEAARFAKRDGRSETLVAKDPPSDYAAALMSRVGHWSFKPLHAIVEAPTLRPGTWSVLQKPGYDEQSGLYFEPGDGAFTPIDERPTPDDAARALETLREPFAEFPFIDEAAGSVALAAVLTALVRRSLPTAPMFLFDAPVRSSGKTLLVRAISHIATGHETANTTFTGDPNEERKRILSLLIAGDPIVCLDNIDRPLEGDTLCAVLTSPFFQDRQLGISKMVTVPTCTTWFATGNNVTVRGDLATRVLPCRIDPQVERPETRAFKRLDLLGYLSKFRAPLVAAALTMMRAYVVAGKPKQPVRPFGRFEDWSAIVRSTFLWLGCADPCEPQERLLRDDPAAQDVGMILAALHDLYRPPLKFTVAMAVRSALDGSTASIPLKQALESALPRGDIKTRALGYWLRTHKDRIIGGLCLKKYGDYDGLTEWQVINLRPDDNSDLEPF